MNQNTSLKEFAYDLLKKKIINCEIMPGQDILEDQIAKELGVSKTPIRQAVHQLEQEKFLCIYPRKGTIVTPISVDYVYEVFNARELIEPQIGKRICESVSSEMLNNFKSRFEKINLNVSTADDQKCLSLDREFHSFIVKSGKNRFVTEMMEKILDHDQRIRMMSIKSESVKDSAAERYQSEHLQIIDAFIDRDEAKVEELLLQHIRKSKKAALELKY